MLGALHIAWLHNIDELKQGLVHVWDGMDQTIIDSAIDEWRGRLRACVRAKCGHWTNADIY